MEQFKTKVNSKEEFISLLIELNEIDALGSNVVIGTEYVNNIPVSDILSDKIDVYTILNIKEIVVELNNKNKISKYSTIFGSNFICVTLLTETDEIYAKEIEYKDFITETEKFV